MKLGFESHMTDRKLGCFWKWLNTRKLEIRRLDLSAVGAWKRLFLEGISRGPNWIPSVVAALKFNFWHSRNDFERLWGKWDHFWQNPTTQISALWGDVFFERKTKCSVLFWAFVARISDTVRCALQSVKTLYAAEFQISSHFDSWKKQKTFFLFLRNQFLTFTPSEACFCHSQRAKKVLEPKLRANVS